MSWKGVAARVGGGRRLFVGGIGGATAFDVLLRLVPEMVGLGDTVIISSGAVFVTTYVFEAQHASFLLGWAILFALAFNFTPHLYPLKFVDAATSYLTRFTVAASSTAVGVVTVDGVYVLVASVSGQVSRQAMVTPKARTAIAVLAGVTILHSVATVAMCTDRIPPIGADTRWLSRPHTGQEERESTERSQQAEPVDPDPTVSERCSASTVIRGGLMSVALGVVLAAVYLLYPVTELFVLGYICHELLAAHVGFFTPGLGTGLEERLAMGAAAAWASSRHIVSLLFAACILLTASMVSIGLNTQTYQGAAGRPGDTLLALVVTVATFVYVLRYVARILVRIPYQVEELRETRFTTPDIGTDGEAPYRIAGFMVPAALVYAVIAEGIWMTSEGIAITVALAAIMLLLSYEPSPWRLTLSDYDAVPVAAGVTVAINIGASNLNKLGVITGLGLVDVFWETILFTGVAMGWYFVPRGVAAWRRGEPVDGHVRVESHRFSCQTKRQLRVFPRPFDREAIHWLDRALGGGMCLLWGSLLVGMVTGDPLTTTGLSLAKPLLTVRTIVIAFSAIPLLIAVPVGLYVVVRLAMWCIRVPIVLIVASARSLW
jgi:hypothetical protein